MIVLADMPLIFPDFLSTLAELPAPAATSYDEGKPGVPALLDRRLIKLAAELTGDRGLGPLLGDATILGVYGMLRDVDTPADLVEVERQLSAR